MATSVKTELLETIKLALTQLKLKPVEFSLEHPANEAHGDYAANIAFVLYPQVEDQWSNPLQLAEAIVAAIKLKVSHQSSSIIDSVSVAGPGFINFSLKPEHFLDYLNQLINSKQIPLTTDPFIKQRICVEYTDPNPFKELHLGHLYSNIIGETMARLYEAVGAKVWRADYYGDVGQHVAKAIWGMQQLLTQTHTTLPNLAKKSLLERQKFLGQSYAYGVKQFESDPEVKATINRLNPLIYAIAQALHQANGWQPVVEYEVHVPQSDFNRGEIRSLYQSGLAWSLEYFESLYQFLGTKFDGYYPESLMGEYGYRLVQHGLKQGVFTKSQGAIIFPGEKHGTHTRVFINKLNLPTYEAKELGLAPAKYQDFPYDQSLIVTGTEIKDYFKVVLTAMKLVSPDLGHITTVLSHGMVKLPQGKMSSRSGNVVTVQGLIAEASAYARTLFSAETHLPAKAMDQIAQAVGLASIRYAFLKGDVTTDVIFDFKQSISFEGNSGPYLQYTYARCASVLSKSPLKIKNFKLKMGALNPEELALLRWFYRYPEVVAAAAQNLTPHLLCTYLYELAHRFNLFYHHHLIIGSDFRLGLTTATAKILKSGLELLGIEAPEKM
ncbi:arginine--tRNA ligase [Microgenomates group bacterium RBG_16_45_19]|nr:MAG: arginine--tRNA ligase [Microgenomates group bacterium RBG_16_45_19]